VLLGSREAGPQLAQFSHTGPVNQFTLRHPEEEHPLTHFAHLDFLRASAVMIVLFSHLIGTVATTSRTGLGTAAHFGVLMFFVHTSLVLFMSLERMPSGQMVRQFYVRRIFRIYPLAVLTVVFMFWNRFPPAPWQASFQLTQRDVLTNLFLVQNLTGNREILATMWSLPFEVQMYAVLPLLFALRTRVHAFVVWGMALGIAEGMLASHSRAGEILRYAPCFCAGLVAYWLVRRKLSIRVRFGLMPVALLIGVVTFVLVGHFTGLSALSDSLAALGVGTLTGLVHGPIPPPVSQICAVIAKYSYGIYLSHLPIMMFCFGAGRTPVRFLLFSLLIISIPILLYHAIEYPMVSAGIKISLMIGRGVGSPRELLSRTAAR
jgi:peptidoglycan/LPS O-acetylase OafA/YrhL